MTASSPIDIVMPYWGRLDYVVQAVESVVAQTDPNWRLTVVDDHYPDGAAGRFITALNDPRITYVRNDVNLGVSANFVRCASLIEHDHAVVMGCDDRMLPNFVAEARALIERFPDADMLQMGVEVIDEHGKRVKPLIDRVKALLRLPGRGGRAYSGERIASSLLQANWMYFPSIVWRSATLKAQRFRADLPEVQDLDAHLRILFDGGTIVVDDTVTFAYRRHSSSMSMAAVTEGSRFTQESIVYREAAARAAQLGWRRTAFAARLHATSRLNALVQLPTAVARRDPRAIGALTHHAIGR